jgi:hypothetical protein
MLGGGQIRESSPAIRGAIALITGSLLVVGLIGCHDETGQTPPGEWGLDAEEQGGDAAPADTTDDTGGLEEDTGSPVDTGAPDLGPDDTSVGNDVGPDTAPGPDGGGEGLTRRAVVGTWYGVSRLTQKPAITGSVQEVVFEGDGSVRIGFNGAVTGKWQIFDDDSIQLYDLVDRQGDPNRPEQFLLEAEFENDRLVAFELFIGQGPDDTAYKLRYEQLASPAVPYAELVGQWQSKKVMTNQMGRKFRLVLRAEQNGKLAYGVYTGNYVEFARGDGRTITYDTGETHWFIASNDAMTPPLGGEVRIDDAGELVVWAPRGIQTNSTPQPEKFEAVEMVPTQNLSL